MKEILILILPLLLGWLLDFVFGDPSRLPHPIVWFGKMIAWGEHRLNHGLHRMVKGAVMAICLILMVFFIVWGLKRLVPNMVLWLILDTIIIFYCLAGTTLIRDASNFTGLTPHHFRIATQSPPENDALVAAIRNYALHEFKGTKD